MPRPLTTLSLAAAALLSVAEVAAEPAGSYPAAGEAPRHGWTGGGSIGIGSLALHDPDAPGSPDGDDVGALGFELHVGGLVRPDLALLVGYWGGVHGCADCDRSDELVQSNIGIAAQYWPTPRLWVVAGLGSARLGRLIEGDRAWLRAGTSLLAGVGYELLHQRSYALDVQFRLTAAGYKDSDMGSSLGALLLGVSWY